MIAEAKDVVDPAEISKLKDALKDGKIQGMVVTTKTSGRNLAEETVGEVTSVSYELKDWAEIGDNVW